MRDIIAESACRYKVYRRLNCFSIYRDREFCLQAAGQLAGNRPEIIFDKEFSPVIQPQTNPFGLFVQCNDLFPAFATFKTVLLPTFFAAPGGGREHQVDRPRDRLRDRLRVMRDQLPRVARDTAAVELFYFLHQ